VGLTALVNHYYFYCVDRDFGPFFLKFCSYFPYNAKIYLHGHEYLKRQLQQQGIAYEALDNGIFSCQDARRLQAICDGLSPAKIEAQLRKWLRLLPHPFSARDRQAGYRYDLSILQIELSLTQVLDRPVTGRIFFEEVIRENLNIGPTAGPASRTTDPRPDDLPVATTSPPRDDSTRSRNASLPGHPTRPASRTLLYTYVQSSPSAWPSPSPTLSSTPQAWRKSQTPCRSSRL
jgi:hypothetical protein